MSLVHNMARKYVFGAFALFMSPQALQAQGVPVPNAPQPRPPGAGFPAPGGVGAPRGQVPQIPFEGAPNTDPSVLPGRGGFQGAPLAQPPANDTPVGTITIPEKSKTASAVPPGQELVSIHFPEPTDITQIIKAVSVWTGKNVLMDTNIRGKVQIISPRKVTKEEAYQAFLSALNLLQLTTVETGKVMKILPVRTAVKGNLKTYLGADWTPRTDAVITQIIPLKYIDAKAITQNLSKLANTNSVIAYEPTNTLIVTDSGYKVQRILEIVKLLDVQGQQPQVSIVPVRYADAKEVAKKVQTILGGGGSSRSGSKKYFSYKILTDERSNSVVLFGPPRTISDVKDLVKRFDIKVEDGSRQASIHVRPLDYADAKKLAATLSSLTGSSSRSSRTTRTRRTAPTTQVANLGEGVKITADESSNSLLITGSRSDYQSVNAIIRKLDVRKSQVYIETDILDVDLTGDFSFGLSTLVGDTGGGGLYDALPISWQGSQGIGSVITGSVAAAAAGSGTAGAGGVAAANQLGNTFFSDNLVVGLLKNINLNIAGLGEITTGVLVNMLKTDGDAKTLSTPNILTSNNEKASVVVGETRYFGTEQTNAAAGTTERKFEKVDANLSLTITPSISHSNYITLDIDLTAESFGTAPTGQIPPVNKRTSKQIITVKNKQTVVIGGLERDTENNSYSKVPLLGDIPIIGHLFRSTIKNKSKTQLLMFMTPYIVHGANDLADIYATKRRQMDEFLFRAFGSKFRKSKFYKRIPTYADGRYLQSEADLYEQQNRKQMMDGLYNDATTAGPGDVVNSTYIDSTPLTVPSGGFGGGGNSSPSDAFQVTPTSPQAVSPNTAPIGAPGDLPQGLPSIGTGLN